MELTAAEARRIESDENPEWELVNERMHKQKRWSVVYENTYSHNGKFYSVWVFRPATECQDDQDVFNDKDPVDFWEVRAVENTITVYDPV